MPLKRAKADRKYKSKKERAILMRKRTKRSRLILCMPQTISQYIYIEEQIVSTQQPFK